VASEASRLRVAVGQLEHALTARISVEQAIGVLAERHRIKPRQAFEQLRSAARSRGRKVIDIAADVVASATNPLLQLPDELSRPRSGPRRGARQPRGA
jgi:AmiR/NasT family two-component response regulator